MKRWPEANYTVQIETVDSITAHFATCKTCGEKSLGVGEMDAYFAGARHQRENHYASPGSPTESRVQGDDMLNPTTNLFGEWE